MSWVFGLGKYIYFVIHPILVVGSVLIQSYQLSSVGWGCTEPTVVKTTLGIGPAEDVKLGWKSR